MTHFIKDGITYNEQQIRHLFPHISFPPIITHNDVLDLGFIPRAEEELSLEERRSSAKSRVEEMARVKGSRFAYDFGMPYGKLHMQIRDADDKANWIAVKANAMEIMNAGQWSATLSVRTEENVVVTQSVYEINQMLSAMSIFASQIMARSWALKDAISSSDNPESVDIETGWPS